MKQVRIKTATIVLTLVTILFGGSLKATDSSVTGSFKGNGQDAKLAFATARKGDPFSGKATTEVILSEKDPSSSAKPSMDAMFGKLGSALALTITSDGDLIGAQIIHSALKHPNFSSIGPIKLDNYKLEQGVIQGHAATTGESEFFGDKWSLDLTFKAKVP